jgi:hypothetical protein
MEVHLLPELRREVYEPDEASGGVFQLASCADRVTPRNGPICAALPEGSRRRLSLVRLVAGLRVASLSLLDCRSSGGRRRYHGVVGRVRGGGEMGVDCKLVFRGASSK